MHRLGACGNHVNAAGLCNSKGCTAAGLEPRGLISDMYSTGASEVEVVVGMLNESSIVS